MSRRMGGALLLLGAIVRWEAATRKLVLTLVKESPSADAVRHWANHPSGGGGVIAQGMDYFARITYTLKSAGPSVDQAAIESYHFYIQCPMLQMNPGGRLKARLRGAEEMGMKTPTKASWDLRVDTAIHVK